jgi:ATP-binding cassette, subfamily C, bacterial CydCD
MFHVKPVDPRLLRYARTTRAFLAASVLLGAAGAGLIVAQAALIADVVVGGFQHGRGPGELRGEPWALAGVALGRALVVWLTELCAHRAGAAVKSELRGRLLRRVTELGPGWLTGRRSGELTTLATRGIDALDDYFARYLPQLGLAVVVPAVVLARIATADWVSALTIALTLPLIPLFMVLVGWATRDRMDRQWRLLGRLSGHFLDVVAGLPTLKVFGRAKVQADSIRRITGDYRRATLRTLRIAFLSSFVLELLAMISVALVAVGIGMRLVHGELDLRTGLLVLVLAPEAYLPLRQVGRCTTRRPRGSPQPGRSSRCWRRTAVRPPAPPGPRPICGRRHCGSRGWWSARADGSVRRPSPSRRARCWPSPDPAARASPR